MANSRDISAFLGRPLKSEEAARIIKPSEIRETLGPITPEVFLDLVTLAVHWETEGCDPSPRHQRRQVSHISSILRAMGILTKEQVDHIPQDRRAQRLLSKMIFHVHVGDEITIARAKTGNALFVARYDASKFQQNKDISYGNLFITDMGRLRAQELEKKYAHCFKKSDYLKTVTEVDAQFENFSKSRKNFLRSRHNKNLRELADKDDKNGV